ncbi:MULTISPECIES: CpsD/CapB family tyrosine-protein kinase [Mesobacillus]|nr:MULTISPECIES: CpsD/CapB family tyrosine-protein kinase [Mesobacillus]MDQ0414647.1 capsular exopolysaccharide synthesis family protein [Mesobacillus stamsii]
MLRGKRKNRMSAPKRNLITFSNPESIISEQFRTLRTNIHFLTEGKKSIILITSPGSHEGKTTTTANLAVSMAQQKEKVLLVDANLREPAIHFIFKKENTVGLTEVLSGKIRLEEAIIPTDIGSLAILTSGQMASHPAELIGSDSLYKVLQQALEEYDFILVDSPPILDVTDTKLLAHKSDGVILVISQGKTEIEKAVEAKKALEFAKVNLFGVILYDM